MPRRSASRAAAEAAARALLLMVPADAAKVLRLAGITGEVKETVWRTDRAARRTKTG